MIEPFGALLAKWEEKLAESAGFIKLRGDKYRPPEETDWGDAEYAEREEIVADLRALAEAVNQLHGHDKVKSQACIVVTELTSGHLDFRSLEFTGTNRADDDNAPAATALCDQLLTAFKVIHEHAEKHPGEPLFKEEQ